MIAPVVLSPPFANYISISGTTRTYGTFTLSPRGGLPWRVWRIVASLRYSFALRSWRNKLGLPNPGIMAFLAAWHAGTIPTDAIVSVHGFSGNEWETLVSRVMNETSCFVELNLSCPNITHRGTAREVWRAVKGYEKRVIVKIPPLDWSSLVTPLFYGAGITCFHCCNTLPTPGGGLSGAVLKPYSLWAVRELRQALPATLRLIGGGGIMTTDDVDAYHAAGADHVALGSIFLHPLRWRHIPGIVAHATNLFLPEEKSM